MFMKESAIEDRKMISIYTQHGTIQIQKKQILLHVKREMTLHTVIEIPQHLLSSMS